MNNNKVTTINMQTGAVRTAVAVNYILLLLQAMIAITPYLSRNVSYIINFVLWGLWIVSTLSLPGQRIINGRNKVLVWWCIYMIWILLSCIIGHSNVSINTILITLPTFSIPIMMTIVLSYYNKAEKKVVWRFLFIIFLISFFHNFYLGLTNPTAFEGLDGIDASKSENATNAGGTAFVAMCLWVSAICWIVLRKANEKSMKVKYLVLLAFLLIYLLYMNNRATVIIILIVFVVGFLLTLRNKNPRKKNRRRSVFLLILLAFVFFRYALIPLLEWLIESFADSKNLVDRFSDLLLVAEGTNPEDLESGSLGARYLLWMTSIKTWLSEASSFLFGIGEDAHGYSLTDLLKAGVSCHSEFFDILAKYGLAGALIIYSALNRTFSQILSITEDYSLKRMTFVFIVGFIIYSFVNLSFVSGFFFIVFIFYPLTLIFINQDKYVNKTVI